MTTTTTLPTVTVLHTEQPLIRCTARFDLPEYNIKAGETFLLQRIRRHTYIIKKLSILSRRETDKSVRFTVKNGDGKEYHPQLNRSGQHTCDCDAYTKGHRSCYHVYFVKSVTNAGIRTANEARRKEREAVSIAIPQTPEEVMELANQRFALSTPQETREAISEMFHSLVCKHGDFQIAGRWFCYTGDSLYATPGNSFCSECYMDRENFALNGNVSFNLLKQAC